MSDPVPMHDGVRVALVGLGRMGQAIDALAASRACTVVARLDGACMARGITAADLRGAHVAIEFTTPDAAADNIDRLLGLRCPVVSGTTGWSTPQATLDALVRRHQCAALWAPNFSVGVQLFLGVLEDAARRLRAVPGFDMHLVETHHTAKRDAPSGTALALVQAIERAAQRVVPITSVRVGHVPGTHEVVADAPFEQLRFTHEARDRRVFADGALLAARWLAAGRAPAVYALRDVLDVDAPSPFTDSPTGA